MTNLVDEVERLGAIVDGNGMTARDAAHELKRTFDNLTIPGCAELIKNWKDVRSHYGA